MPTRKRIRLTEEEREIERTVHEWRPVTGKKLEKIERALAQARKTKNINIRLSEDLLDALKRRSEQQGIPYQTLITSILHRYATNRLVDQAEVGRVMEAVTDGNWQGVRSKK